MTRPTVVVNSRFFGLRGISSTRILSFSKRTSLMTLLLDRQPHLDAGMDADLLGGERQEHLGRAGENVIPSPLRLTGMFLR